MTSYATSLVQKAVYVVLLLITLPFTGYANEQAIATIRTRYAKVDQELKHCKRVERDLVGHSTEGGSLTFYSLRSSPRKLVAQYYGEAGKATEEYYFWNNRLFFVLRSDARYDKPLGQAVETIQSRFYFDKGQLLRWLETPKNDVPRTQSETQNREQEVLKKARELLDLANGNTRS